MLPELIQRATHRPWDPAMTTALVWTWLGLEIAGQILLLLLTATLFFSRRLRSQRHPVLINFVVTWLISTIPACLLLYGNSHDHNQPTWGLCLYNAALISGVPPMVSLAFLAVVIQVYIMMRCVTNQMEYVRRPWLTVLLIAAPYVAFVIAALITGIIGFYDPANVSRQPEIVFCAVRGHNIGKSIWGFTILVVAATFAVGLALVLLMWRNWRGVRQNSIVDMNFVIRALCFTVFELFMLTTYMLSVFLDSVPPKFMQALAPLAVFLIFSTQPDVLRAWFFCFGKKDVAVTAPNAPQQAHSFDEEKGSPGHLQNYLSQDGSNSTMSPPTVLSSRFSTATLITAPPESGNTVSAPSHILGLRTLRLTSSVSVPAPIHRPTHGYSNSTEGRPRVVGTHPPNMHSPAPSYSDLSYRSTSSGRSTGSGAPLLRTITLGSPERALYNSSTVRRSEAGVMVSTADSRSNSAHSRGLGNRI